MTQTLYDKDGYMIIPSVVPQPIPLVVQNCNRIELTCDDRDYQRSAWRVVDARAGVCWPMRTPKGLRK